jgi:hypothetical protein
MAYSARTSEEVKEHIFEDRQEFRLQQIGRNRNLIGLRDDSETHKTASS